MPRGVGGESAEVAGGVNALCATRPADWWMVPDDGNRLALLICSVCPELARCPQGDPHPHGVIRAGVAWGDHGERLPICACGRPTPNTERSDCFTCEPRWDIRIPRPLRVRRRRYSADVLMGEIVALRRDGATLRDVSARLRIPYSTLRDIIRRHPQAVSTVVDGGTA